MSWSELLPAPQAIERIDAPSARVFAREYERPGRPVVLAGAAAHWPAVRRWSPAFFASRFARRTARAYRQTGQSILRDARVGLVMADVQVGDVLAHLDGADAPAHRIKEALRLFPELAADIVAPEYRRGGLDHETYLWITPRGATTLLHWDMPHNLYAQIHGRKQFVLVAPEERARVYPFPFWSSTPQCSRVDVTQPDLARFPRLRELRPRSCTLDPGDVLFLPSGWWHSADSPTPTISVNLWWLTWRLLPRAIPTGLQRRLLGSRY